MKIKTKVEFTHEEVVHILIKHMFEAGIGGVQQEHFDFRLTEGRGEDRGGDAVEARIDKIIVRVP